MKRIGRRAVAPWFSAALSLAIALVAFAPVVTFVHVALQRLGYPLELEWMGGGVIDHVRIVLSGQPLYRAPSVDFTPFIYTPLYYYLVAAVSQLVGTGLVAARVTSFAAI